MNPLFTDTVTAYLYSVDAGTRQDSWRRVVLRGVQWAKRTEKTIGGNGVLQAAQSVTLTIPADVDSGGQSWAFNPAGNQDMVVLGELNQELSPSYTPAMLRKQYHDCAVVKSVEDCTLRRFLKHWSVTAV